MQCPICGTHFVPASPGQVQVGGSWRRQEWQEFGYTSGPGMLAQPGSTLERQTPTRSQSKEADVAVPFLKSAVYALVGGSLALIPTTWAAITKGWPWYVPPVAGGVIGLVSFSIAWVALDQDVRRTLWQLETWSGADLDHDGHVGPPPVVRVELTDKPNRSMRLIDLPLPDDKLKAVAKGLAAGRSFSRRGLSGILTESEFTALSGAMLEGNLVRYRQADNPRSGFELAPAGRALVRKLVGRGVGGGGDAETDTTRPRRVGGG
jgi:hypothetical protein